MYAPARAREMARTRSWGALPAQRAVSSALESAFRHELEGLLVRQGARHAASLAAHGGGGVGGGGALGEALVGRVDSALDALGGGDARRVEAGVAALREEVAALKHAIDAGFDIQLDIQRAVRQEVAAAMHAQGAAGAETSACTVAEGAGDAAAGAGAVAWRRHRTVDGGACVICLDRQVDSLLYACGHMCTCAQCGRQLIAHGEACPICRAPIRDVVVAYMTG